MEVNRMQLISMEHRRQICVRRIKILIVLGILVFQVLPVFTGVYASLAGSMAASAYCCATVSGTVNSAL